MSQLRMLIAEWLIFKATQIAPKNDEGKRLAEYVLAFMNEMQAKYNRGKS